MNRKYFLPLLLVLLLVFSSACEDDLNFGPDYSLVPAHFFDECDEETNQWDFESDRFDRLCGLSVSQVEGVVKTGGLKVRYIIPGDSTVFASERERVLTRYTIRNSERIITSSTWQNGLTGPIDLDFEIPRTGSITNVLGVRLGIIGMSPGEIRSFVIPPAMGFTTGQFASDTLLIDFELTDILQ